MFLISARQMRVWVEHSSAPNEARTARVAFAQLLRSPPAAAAAQRDRVRCDAERQQRVGLLVDAAAAAYPSCRPAAAAKHPSKWRAQALVLLKACFQAQPADVQRRFSIAC